MKKIYYTWKDIENAVTDIAVQLYKSNWRPDYIVGIHSGGNIPSIMLGKMLGIKTHSIDVRLRDSDSSPESNFWMSEDAIGYDLEPKKILVVDDINDSGATIEWIMKDWQSSCLPNDERWNTVWHNSTRFAVLVNNLASNTCVNYSSIDINKEEDDCWLVFPWEEWYKFNA